MKRNRFSEEQIIGILKEHEVGVSVADLCMSQHDIEHCKSAEQKLLARANISPQALLGFYGYRKVETAGSQRH